MIRRGNPNQQPAGADESIVPSKVTHKKYEVKPKTRQLMNHTTRLLVVLLGFALPLGMRCSAADKPVKHRILFTEYGKGPNRFVELDADGKMVWEFNPPSITVIFQVLPNGNILFGYGGTPTGVREITSRGETVFDYVSKSHQVFGCERLENGNTLVAEQEPCQAVEVNPRGEVAHVTPLTCHSADHERAGLSLACMANAMVGMLTASKHCWLGHW